MKSDNDLTFLEENGFLDNNTEKTSLADKLEGKTKQYVKQTAVEWLHEKLATSKLEDMQKNINLWFQQAKEMEKQQIVDAWNKNPQAFNHSGEQYYNETYKNQLQG